MQIVFAAVGIIVIFWVVFWLAQRVASHASDARDVRHTLETGARMLGGSDYLRSYPPVKSEDEM